MLNRSLQDTWSERVNCDSTYVLPESKTKPRLVFMVNQIAADEAGSVLLDKSADLIARVNPGLCWILDGSAVIEQIFRETLLAEARKKGAIAK